MCQYSGILIITTDSQTERTLEQLSHIQRLVSEESNGKEYKSVVIYLSLDQISRESFERIEASMRLTIGPKLLIIPSLNTTDKQSLSSNSSEIRDENEVMFCDLMTKFKVHVKCDKFLLMYH